MSKNKPKHINFQDENDSDFEADAQPAKQQEEYDQNYLIEQKQKLMGFRKNLPIYSGRSKIIEYIRKNEVTIIVGETGSGKTTQIPQYLFEDKFIQGNRSIAVTQPRKVAAVSLAGRVAQEAGSSVGDLVGYSVRFDNCCSEKTRIKYVTDGMLLRESLMDPNFDQYSVIILDEAHERTLRTDVLLGLCKEALQKRKKTKNPLKLVVMSATLQADKFSDFFNNAPILWVEGRTFPVKMMYTVTPYPDYLDACILTVFQIHLTQPLGDILVFLTGQEEIESLEKAIKEYTEKLPPSTTKLVVATLFANLPSQQQQQTLTPLPKGQRKVILSTNIAETSLTIPNVKYIIDPGLAKVRGFDSNVGIESLLVQPISQSGAQQRAGRAGREAAGTCYRLYTEDTFKSMSVEDIPEIQRCNLAFAVLTLKAFGIKDILKFPFMTPPARKGLILALEHLYSLNALDNKGELTQLGRDMSSFPLEPRFAKILLESKKFGCTDPILSILSLLSVDNLFYSNSENREQAQEAKKKFINTTGDHLTYLNLYKSYKSHNGSAAWCKKNFVNKRSMNYVDEIKNQLVGHCERLGIDPKTTTDDSQTILQCLLTGNFMNTALLQPDGTYRSVMGKQKVNIHPMSTIFTKKPEAVMYNELIFTTKHYMRGISVIVPQWIVQSAPHYLGKKSN